MNNSSRSYYKIGLSFFVVFVALFILFIVYVNRKGRLTCLNYRFNGKVENVVYNVKGQAYITVKGVTYYLFDSNWDFDHNRIDKGDSIIKNSKSMIIRLVKQNGRIIIEGEND